MTNRLHARRTNNRNTNDIGGNIFPEIHENQLPDALTDEIPSHWPWQWDDSRSIIDRITFDGSYQKYNSFQSRLKFLSFFPLRSKDCFRTVLSLFEIFTIFFFFFPEERSSRIWGRLQKSRADVTKEYKWSNLQWIPGGFETFYFAQSTPWKLI